jgi:putative oxidoreductase
MKHAKNILKTDAHFSGPALRLSLGMVLLAHGCQLLLGWFGGYGFDATMQYLMENNGLPWLVSFMVIALQFFGALAILAGVATRLFSFAVLILFIGMIVTSHLDYGFFMNWYGTQKGEGYEYHILVLGMAAGLAFSGAGAYSFDRYLTLKMDSPKERKMMYAWQ